MTGGPARLTRSSLRAMWPELADALPDGRVGMVHFGLGAFHRAHQAVFAQEAMRAEAGDWAICAVSQRRPAVRDALAAQDCLFTVAERSTAGETLRVVGSVREVLLATAQPDRLRDVLSDEDTKVVTITVTESGYRHDPATGRLRVTDPEVTGDLAGRPPRTVIGQLVHGLRRRRDLGNTGLTVLSCDNLPDNGRLVARLVHDFCLLGRDSALADWVREHVRFPSGVVDQIVPATTDADRARATEWLGLTDRGAVVGEQYRQWVIEDDFATERPAWDRVGVRLVPDIGPYQAAKLRVVNGTHSALAYLGMLAGCTSTAEAVARDEFARYAERLLRTETGASLARFGRVVGNGEIRVLLDRLANPRITHRLARIGADGLRKLPPRLLEPAAELLDAGTEPEMICLALAGFLHHLRRDQNGPVQGETPAQQVAALLAAWPAVPADLRESAHFRGLLADAVDRIGKDGVVATLRRTAGRSP